MIYAFYIFDKHCSCIYAREFSHSTNSQGLVNKSNDSDMAQLLFGTIHSLKHLSAKLAPEAANTLSSFSTGQYRYHFLESLTNFKFVLVTDLAVDNLQPQLWELYTEVFVKNILYNALSPVEFGASKLTDSRFTELSDDFLRQLPVFGGP